MMLPDGTWVCPICKDQDWPPVVDGPTCWHPEGGANGKAGCSTWYGGRLLHLSGEELESLRESRPLRLATGGFLKLWQLVALGMLTPRTIGDDLFYDLTAEGENLCRHLWGLPEPAA